ncbi:MAG: right-handed parallel beta-helix repeat-containing protein, partial [Eubacteriales bacterium]|nr:right-handed parallel beta-helix repeat-containing protein [Eubacteriales bacterium]
SVKIYSAENPALIYKDIECALTRYIIDETKCSYVGYDGLCLKYGAGDAISNSAGPIHHITVRNCDICHIGGGFTAGVYENGLPARFGNGIQIWGSANDIVIEHCKIWEVYDAAISPQCTVENRTYNIYIRNNRLSGFEYGLELWNRPESSALHDVYFEHNVLEGAGMCWAHSQRPNPRAAFFELHYTNSETNNIFIRYNVCRESAQYFINVLNGASFNGIEDMVINNNVYYIGNGGGESRIFAIWAGGKKFTADAVGVGGYIAATGKDTDSRFVFK